MSATLKSLRALADPTRLRLMALLQREELSVNELQEITGLGQSRISTHLGQLQDSGLLESRREGLMPFTTTSPGAVAAGTINPPGHMQNENTPRSRPWSVTC